MIYIIALLLIVHIILDLIENTNLIITIPYGINMIVFLLTWIKILLLNIEVTYIVLISIVLIITIFTLGVYRYVTN